MSSPLMQTPKKGLGMDSAVTPFSNVGLERREIEELSRLRSDMLLEERKARTIFPPSEAEPLLSEAASALDEKRVESSLELPGARGDKSPEEMERKERMEAVKYHSKALGVLAAIRARVVTIESDEQRLFEAVLRSRDFPADSLGSAMTMHLEVVKSAQRTHDLLDGLLREGVYDHSCQCCFVVDDQLLQQEEYRRQLVRQSFPVNDFCCDLPADTRRTCSFGAFLHWILYLVTLQWLFGQWFSYSCCFRCGNGEWSVFACCRNRPRFQPCQPIRRRKGEETAQCADVCGSCLTSCCMGVKMSERRNSAASRAAADSAEKALPNCGWLFVVALLLFAVGIALVVEGAELKKKDEVISAVFQNGTFAGVQSDQSGTCSVALLTTGSGVIGLLIKKMPGAWNHYVFKHGYFTHKNFFWMFVFVFFSGTLLGYPFLARNGDCGVMEAIFGAATITAVEGTLQIDPNWKYIEDKMKVADSASAPHSLLVSTH